MLTVTHTLAVAASLLCLLRVQNAAAFCLDDVLLVDGHNDLPNNLWMLEQNNLNDFDFTKNLTTDEKWGNCSSCFTDLPRLRRGKVGAQFWVAYVGCNTQYRDAVARTLEQIDVIKRLVRKYPHDMELVTDADGIMAAFKQRKIASLIGIEGGHSMDARVGVLRMLYELGARYMTLTHTCQTPWADSSLVDTSKPVHNLTAFGKALIKEMNRLGMMVDLSHVSHEVMNQAIATSRAPVIFSHSSAYGVCPHHRNVHDDTLKKLKNNDGIIMVNFYPEFISATPRNASIHDVVKHIDYIAECIGVEHLGIGADFDGVSGMPIGLEDVSKYPDLFHLLAKTSPKRWTPEALKKLASENLIRVFKRVEKVRDSLVAERPMQRWISIYDLLNVEELNVLWQCRTFLGQDESQQTLKRP